MVHEPCPLTRIAPTLYWTPKARCAWARTAEFSYPWRTKWCTGNRQNHGRCLTQDVNLQCSQHAIRETFYDIVKLPSDFCLDSISDRTAG